MTSPIRGITRTSLWEAWKEIRKDLRHSSIRDSIDFLDYDLDPDSWINRLLLQITSGTYEPHTPFRFPEAKKQGFSRRMTLPLIPDLVLYRAIVDYLFERFRRREQPHVHFDVRTISNEQRRAVISAQNIMTALRSEYKPQSRRSFLAWLQFNQYRKYLIFKKIYLFIIITDISNFFESILHSDIARCFHEISAPPRMVGLLFFLLERLSIRDEYSSSQSIGLSVDEFGCSRRLAHLLLFEHDQRMVTIVGKDAYVRWMDDQNIGVTTRAKAIKVLSNLGRSLSRMHLTANDGKTKILTLSEARRHFHLDLNRMLDEAEVFVRQKKIKELRSKVKDTWKKAKQYDGIGQWEKVLSRIYRHAGIGAMRFLRNRAATDILRAPRLSERISDYMRCTGSVTEFFQFAESIWLHGEQVYEDVNYILLETMLRLEPKKGKNTPFRQLASKILKDRWRYPGSGLCVSTAPLLILRFGDRRSLPLLRNCFDSRLNRMTDNGVRAAAFVYASYGRKEFAEVRRAAARMHRNVLSRVISLVERISGI